jgi:uncharacterized repeat protein (TIGR01451 family)
MLAWICVLQLTFLTLALSGQAALAADVQPTSFLDDPDPVPAGGIVTYTVDVHNNASDPAQNPRLELTVPVGFDFASADDPACSYGGNSPSTGGAGDIVTCAWTTLAGDSSNVVHIQLTASDTTGDYNTTATVFADNDGNPANDSENNNTAVIASADLVLVSKQSSPNPIAAGGIVTYRFEIRNDGPHAASSLVLTDDLPPGLEFFADNADPAADQDGAWSCSAAGQAVTCTTSGLADGATSIFYFRATVTRPTTGNITNPASISSTTPDTHPDNNTATDNLEVLEGTDMSVSKRVDTDPVIGTLPMQFTVTASNEGPMTALNVEVVDTLPSGYTDISATAPAGWSCTVSGRTVTCNSASVDSGENADIIIFATPPDVLGDEVHQNGATITTDTTDPVLANDTAVVNYHVYPNIADLALSKSKSPDPVALGSNAVSTISVWNNGPQEAEPVQVVDALGANETFVSATGTNWDCSVAEDTNADGSGGYVTCTYQNVPLAPGAHAAPLQITTQATGAGTMTNTACTGGSGEPGHESAEPDAGDTITANDCNGAGVSATSEIADLVVVKTTSDDDITSNEDSFTYTITVTNNGPDTAEDVIFRDAIPQYVAAGTGGRPATPITATTDNNTACTVSNAQVTCPLGNIDNGETVTVTIQVERPMADGTRTNTATAYSTQTGDNNRGNNVDTAVVTVAGVTDIEVTSKAVTYTDTSQPILAGTVATYTIQVRNNGPSLAQGVHLEDVFTGAAFTYLDSSVAGGGSCSYDEATTTLACDLGNMNSGRTKSITVRIRPDQLVPEPGSWIISNTATVTMDTRDFVLTNNEQSLDLEVRTGQTDLAIEKQESADFQEPVRYDPASAGTGNYIVYRVDISNRGPSMATGVTFTDQVTSVSPAQTPVQQLRFVRDTDQADGTAGTFTLCAPPATNPFDVDGSAPVITCPLDQDPAHPNGELASGASYTRYVVFEVLNAPEIFYGDVYHDVATVSGREIETNQGNNEEDENTTVRTVVDLELVKDGPAEAVEVAEHFNFTLTLTNHGPGNSPETTITDTLPSGMVLTGTPGQGTTGVDCTGNAGDTAFTCNIRLPDQANDYVESGQSVSFTVPVTITSYPGSGTITNTASVSSPAPEPVNDPHPNSDDQVVQVHPPGRIGDFVWLDRDNNGIQDAGEPGISGVVVHLLNSSGQPVTDPDTGNPITTTTNSSGYYSFTVNHAADYMVAFDLPADYFFSPQGQGGNNATDSDANSSTGRTGLITVNYGDNIQTVDAGMYQKVSVGDRVWLDENADGIQDGTEPGIAGIPVELLDSGNTVIASAITDGSGNFLFSDLDPGDYSIRISPPPFMNLLAGPIQTADPNNNDNSDSNIASTPAPGVYQSGTVTLSSGSEPVNDGDSDNNTNLSVDFALVKPASIGNKVWLDENSDGLQDAGEPGIANVTVQLKNSAGDIIATTKTDTKGGYLFSNLVPGDYFVDIDETTLPAGMTQTPPSTNANSDFGNQDHSGTGYAVRIASGGENLTADFAYNHVPADDVNNNTNHAAFGDRIWIDTDGDGVQDDSEMPVAGAVVSLFTDPDGDGVFDTPYAAQPTAVTDASGRYIFLDLPAGAYVVEVTDSGSATYDILGADFTQTGDPDHFGGGSALAPPGTAGDNKSTIPVILAPGDVFLNADFGYQPSGATLYHIGDTIWLDINRDGVQQISTESGLAGVTVGLQDADGNFIVSTVTDQNGRYHFDGVADGTYTVVVTDMNNILGGLLPTFDADSQLINPDGKSTVVIAGAPDGDQDFGYAPPPVQGTGSGTIGDTVFLDRNGDNGPSFGEGLEGVRIVLLDDNGNVVAVTTTDENGQYLFTGLADGEYTVSIDQASLIPGIINTVDPDGGLDSISSVTITGGNTDLAQDFGYAAENPGRIGNLIWFDRNGDGVYTPDGLDPTTTDDDEFPIELFVDLYWDKNGNGLVDPGEPLIARTESTDTIEQTNGDSGNYLIDGLPAGDYVVDVSLDGFDGDGFWHSQGTANTTDNSQNDTYALHLDAGGDNVTADFGYYLKPGSLGDRVWKDMDVNGLYDPNIDEPIEGVTVHLDIVYPDGTTVTLNTVTDADGLYSFNNLLLDEDYNGIGNSYGDGGDEPSHTVYLDTTDIPVGLVSIWASRGSNTDSTTVGGAAGDEDDQDMGSDNPAGEAGFPPMGGMDTTNDFGWFEPGRIGDTIWNDQNNNGLFEPLEALSGITVSLTPPDDVDLGAGLGVAVTTVTGAVGEYQFAGLPPGEYTVRVIETSLPPALQGANTVDPDGNNDSTSTVTLAVTNGKVDWNMDQDFAYFRPSSIGNFVWDDSNGNGIQDPDESGHQGITVRLLDADGNQVDDPVRPGIPYVLPTGPNGEYLFENLLPGTYQVEFVLPSNSSFTGQNAGSDDTLDSDPDATGRVTVTVLPSESDLTVDAGLVGPGINIEKATNGIDADTPPGVSVNAGETVTWTYVVTNTGHVPLTGISVTDNRLGAVDCPESSLAVGASMTCTATGTATPGQYSNIGSVIGTPPAGEAVLDSDPSHYLATSTEPAIDIEKSTNGEDADTGHGPLISEGHDITWTYVIRNSGNLALTNISVTDDKLGPITCPATELAVGESMTCSATGSAVVGQYENIGTVTAEPVGGGTPVSDTDPSHYLGIASSPGDIAGIDLEKSTNGHDADVSPGPSIETNTPVTWTYRVTNTGQVDLQNVTVTDNQVADSDIHCPDDGNTDNHISLLAAGDSVTCTAVGTAILGQYENTGSIVGTPSEGNPVEDSDPSHYTGSFGSIDMEKYTNGEDADDEEGPYISVGKEVSWTYVVTNTGAFTLSNINVVDDDPSVNVECPQTTLAPAESMTCTAQGVAVKGQYANIGTVTATTPSGAGVTDSDPSHYFGKRFIFVPLSPCATKPLYCYMVADRNSTDPYNSPLLKYTFREDRLELVNWLGVDDVETMTFSLDGTRIYATNGGVLGTIDPGPENQSSFTPIDPAGIGSGSGEYGTINFNDIDGLSFEPDTGILYGTQRYKEGQYKDFDLLVKIDVNTGHLIRNGFGPGVDYVVIDTSSVHVGMVDDIAFDRRTGILYAIAANDYGEGGDQGIIIDKETGDVTLIGPLTDPDGMPVQDMEGLTVFNHKYIYGTTGVDSPDTNTSNKLYRIEKSTGKTELVTPLDRTVQGYEPSDIEAVTCFPVCN